MPATPRFVTFRNEFAPGLPAPGRGTKDLGKARGGLRFASVVLNNRQGLERPPRCPASMRQKRIDAS